MHEERMHANLRQYRIAPDNIDEAMHLADLHLADRLAEEPGFVAYELMATEDGTVCLMTIFQDPEGAERSQEIAAEFVREHLSDMDVERLGTMTGRALRAQGRRPGAAAQEGGHRRAAAADAGDRHGGAVPRPPGDAGPRAAPRRRLAERERHQHPGVRDGYPLGHHAREGRHGRRARRRSVQHHLRGTGLVALVSDGEPLRLEVSEDPTFADPQAAIAWSGGVTTNLKTDVQAKSLIGMGSGESFQLGFSGQGWVLVQPSEGRLVTSA